MQNNLPNGFVTIEEAIKLIESDTRKDPVVDTAFLVNGLPYLRVNGNYNIKLLSRNDDGKIVSKGNVYVQIKSEWERSNLEHAIIEHYKETSLNHTVIDPEKIGIRSITTAKDEDTNPTGRAMVNPTPMTKFGDPTTGGTRDVEA